MTDPTQELFLNKLSCSNYANWLNKQTELSLSQFDQNLQKAYPSSRLGLKDSASYLDTIGKVCNYIDACKHIDFEKFLRPGSKVLDLGCGGAWLSAMLSKLGKVETVCALDSSRYLLNNIAPDVLEIMGAKKKKVRFIEGIFVPLLFGNSCLDLVVCSSALHHADSLSPVLIEIRRTLRPGGYLIILNETPRSGLRHCLSVFVASLHIIKDLIFQKYHEYGPSVSSVSYLYDPILGDRDYPIWYWKRALHEAGFVLELVVNTGLPTIKRGHGRPLIHFICRAV